MLVLCRISESGLNVVLKDGEIEFIPDEELSESGNAPVTVADGMRVVFSVDEKFYIVAVREMRRGCTYQTLGILTTLA